MYGCTYKIRGKSYSYEELIKEIIKFNSLEFLEIDDILYSRSSGEILQKEVTKKLNELKTEAITEPNKSFNDGEPIISTNDAISMQQLIDHPEFRIKTGGPPP